IADIVAAEEIGSEPNREEMRVPRDLPPYFQELYRTPLLSKSKERALFLKFNFHKYQFAHARRRLDAERVRHRELERLEAILADVPDLRPMRMTQRLIERDEVRQLLSRLSERERDVLAAHFGLGGQEEEATYAEVGARLGLSKERVRQIERGALAKLREQM